MIDKCYLLEYGKPEGDVAVCFTGFLRTFRHTLQSYEEFLFKHVNADIYIACWDNTGNRHWKWSSGREPEEFIASKTLRDFYGPRLKGLAITQFNPERVCPDWVKQARDKNIRKHMIGATCMYYHMWAAKEVRQYAELCFGGHQYRAVVRTRFDIALNQPIWEWIGGELSPGTVYTTAHEGYGVINDQFMFGRQQEMDIIAETYPSIIAKSPPNLFASECPMCPSEILLRNTVQHYGLSVIELPFDYTRHTHPTQASGPSS